MVLTDFEGADLGRRSWPPILAADLGRPSLGIGDVLILPRKGHHVWSEHRPNSPFTQLGCHGGLSDAEMLVPLAMRPLEALVG